MKNTKSINIYMGIIGEAYVDKETAYGVLLAAKKNILDVQAIIKFGEDLHRPLSQAISQAINAISDAEEVYNKLRNAINSQSKDSVIYKKLIALLADLNENDLDNEYSNSGNVYTARENLAFAQSLEQQRLEVIEKANELLDANRLNAVVRCKEYNIAKEIFESMIPDAAITPEDLSDTLEGEYMQALNHIQSNISYISSSSTTISEVSDNVSNKIDEILEGTDENQQIINDIEYGYWYAGNVSPLDFDLAKSLGFTFVNDTTIENKYQDENGEYHYSDFGVDGPLKANHWFHLPKDLARDGQLIAGVDGGKASATNWFIAVPTTVKNNNGEDKELYPCVPTDDTVHTDVAHPHNVVIYTDNNNLGYTRVGNMTVNEVEYVIWKLDSTEFNAQRLNVYMNVGSDNAIEPEEPTDDTVHVTDVEITNAPVYLLAGDTYELQANILPSNATNKNVVWSSSDNSIITVDNNGLITAISEGTVRINVTSVDNNISNFVTIGVTSTINYDNNKKYWFIGDINPNEISNIYSNNNIIGWHELNNELIFNNANLIEFNSPTQYYIVIPNDYNIYAADGNTIAESIYYDIVECNILGYKALQYKRAVWDAKGIVIKQAQNNEEEQEQEEQNYYWYVGPNNSSNISNIQLDNTLIGWHEIGSSLNNFNLTFNNQQMIEFSEATQYYVIIPNSLHIYAADGNTIAEETYYNTADCNISGYKAFQYKNSVWEVKGIVIK